MAANGQESDVCGCPGQHKSGEGTFYFSWGYNRAWYSKSDIHFKNSGSDNYDFTLYKLTAQDRKSDYDNFLHKQLTIPQYVYRLGYFLNDKKNLGVEINFDHTKYVMDGGQTAHLKGTIRGVFYDTDTIVGPGLVRFEHTDGANFMMLNVMKRQYLFKSANKKHWLSAIAKAGAGIVIPRTDVYLFGVELNNKFHVAGYVTGIEAVLRYDFFKYFYIAPSVKGVFANYTNVLTVGTGKANHHFWAFETIGTFGFQLPL
jgi:hypothetical protein